MLFCKMYVDDDNSQIRMYVDTSYRSHRYALFDRPIPDLVRLYRYNNFHSSEKAFLSILGRGSGDFVFI